MTSFIFKSLQNVKIFNIILFNNIIFYQFNYRNSKYSDTSRGNIQAKFLSKNIPPNNLQRGLNSPSMSGLQRQAQSAQLRRWSEAAAHGVCSSY